MNIIKLSLVVGLAASAIAFGVNLASDLPGGHSVIVRGALGLGALFWAFLLLIPFVALVSLMASVVGGWLKS